MVVFSTGREIPCVRVTVGLLTNLVYPVTGAVLRTILPEMMDWRHAFHRFLGINKMLQHFRRRLAEFLISKCWIVIYQLAFLCTSG